MSLNLTTAFVALAADNFHPLVEFYRQLLEQEPTVYRPGIYAEFQLPNLKLGIFHPKAASPTAPSGFSLCLEVEDLDSAIAHFNAIGFPPDGPILAASHGREIYAHDPDGNCLILHQSRSQDA
jgi:predicted enzyme related to lactoylglutathione lyase